MREELRIAEIIPPLAVKIGVKPIHDLVDFGALLQILRISRRSDLVGEIFQDRRTLGQAQVAVLDHRHHAVRIELHIRRLVLLAGEQVDGDLTDGNLALRNEQPYRPARHRYWVHIKFHSASSLIMPLITAIAYGWP